MKHLLIIGFVWPEPNATAAGSRMLQLINLFLEEEYKITFVSTASNKKKSINFKKLGIDTFNIELNNSSFDFYLKKIKPSIVMFDRFLTEEQFGWRVSEICPNAIKILDTEDLHFLRKVRQKAFYKNLDETTELLQNDTTIREIASIYRCDLTLIISKFEINLLENQFNIDSSLLVYTPFLLEKTSKEIINSYPPFLERKDFISVGNFLHEPNWNATLTLKKYIWPKIKKQLPEANLLIFGGYISEKVNQLHNENEGFLIKGWIENIEKAYTKARVCLAPLQFGAGLKGKLIDSMQYGTPNITTTIGAEGMRQNLPWNGFIEDNFDDFAQKSVGLYKNKEIWNDFQQNGIELINSNFNKIIHENVLIELIENLENKLPEHRNSNFIGKILQHNTLRSTKYMGKWIEEKNKSSLK